MGGRRPRQGRLAGKFESAAADLSRRRDHEERHDSDSCQRTRQRVGDGGRRHASLAVGIARAAGAAAAGTRSAADDPRAQQRPQEQPPVRPPRDPRRRRGGEGRVAGCSAWIGVAVMESDRNGGSFRPLQNALVGEWEITPGLAVTGSRTLTLPLEE